MFIMLYNAKNIATEITKPNKKLSFNFIFKNFLAFDTTYA